MDERSDAQDFFDCAECGRRAFWTSTGVSHHHDEETDGVDYDADADHVAYGDPEADLDPDPCRTCAGTGQTGSGPCGRCRGTGFTYETQHAFA